jgi:hypothetical protein
MELIGILVVCVFVAVLFIAWPVAVIWSLNTLFGLGIAFTVKTWLAAVVVMAVCAAGRTATKQ